LQNVALNVIAFLDNQRHTAGRRESSGPSLDVGCGVGDALVAAVLKWAEENKSNRVVVRVLQRQRTGNQSVRAKWLR
jgi:hypothetical protein